MGTPGSDQDQPLAMTGEQLEVTVLRSGGMAGLVRRWTAHIPDDGGLAAQAAHRIAHQTEPEQVQSQDSSPVRDGYLWTLRCGPGELRCDDAARRRDVHLDALVETVTSEDPLGDPADL